MTITKDHLTDSLYHHLDLPKTKSAELVKTLFEIVKKSLAEGEDVLISGFGKFCVKDKHERRGRNPQTGDDLLLRRRKVVTFRCSPVLREKINQ